MLSTLSSAAWWLKRGKNLGLNICIPALWEGSLVLLTSP
jgi:hypothetical protein